MPIEVDLEDELLAAARQEAQRHGRSLEQQVTHWVGIGRAVEQSSDYDHEKVDLALSGKLETSALSEMEKAVWLDFFAQKMSRPSEEEVEFFAKRRDQQKCGQQ